MATAVDCAVFSCGIGVARPDARIYSVVCSQLSVALPYGAAAWRGPVIQSFDEIYRHVDARA